MLEADFIKERIIQASKLKLDLNNSRKWIFNLFLTLNQALIWQLFICQGLYCKDSNGIHLEFNSFFLFQSLFLNLGEWSVGYCILGVISFQKMYGLYGLKHHIVEMSPMLKIYIYWHKCSCHRCGTNKQTNDKWR